MIQVWLLDEDNYFTGESVFVEEVTENMTTVPYTVGYVKGKLVNGEWVEGATEEEIQEGKDSQQIDNCLVPTDQERIIKLEEEKSILAENIYQLASIIETMLGDVNHG